jgi:hypothetical protein
VFFEPNLLQARKVNPQVGYRKRDRLHTLARELHRADRKARVERRNLEVEWIGLDRERCRVGGSPAVDPRDPQRWTRATGQRGSRDRSESE